ncbi:MAG: response regulator [Deltaproteobacteria bacterium]|nr:response regulator [Deltaproteobacteria bacterium]
MLSAFPRWLAAALGLAMLLLLAGGAWFYRTQELQLRSNAEKELQAIAQLKADQIAAWRSDQLAEAAELMSSFFLIQGVERWMANPRSGSPEEILSRLRSVQDHHLYRNILLTDARGAVRLSLSDYRGPVHQEVAEALKIAMRDRKPVLTDLHAGAADPNPHLGVIAPLFSGVGATSGPVGAVIFQIDARQFLYPLIASWPVPSGTSETLLVQRDGEAALFLNDLRHKKDTALKLRIPLSEKDVPAVMAVSGKEGVVKGRDYRGVNVVAALKSIPGSPWYLVAKVDEEEAFAVQRFFSVLILALVLGLVAASAAAVGVVWQRNAKAQYRALFQAETARRESEERYHRLFEHMQEGMAYCKVIFENGEARDFVYLSVNRAFETLTGLKEVIGKRVSEVITGIRDADPGLLETYGRVARTGHPEKFEVFVAALQQWFSISAYCPEPGHFVAVFDVVTERKRVEAERETLEAQLRQAQKMEAVGRLAGGVAHDFNNMLQAILGYAHIAFEKSGPDSYMREILIEIQKAAQRASAVTRQLLAFSRQQTIRPKVLDLNDTVSGMLKMLRRLIGEDIDLAWKPGHELWLIKIDPSQVDQILANLLVNARDAIAGVGKVTIETGKAVFDERYCADHAGFLPGEYVLLAVSDDGCGMDKETLARIFEPFFTTKGVGEGTGLGLATVYGIVKQNGGFVNVYSEPGKGTTFRIYMPRVVAGEAEAPAIPPSETVPGGTETLLLVEDDESILNLARTILEGYGYTLLAARRPGEAIRLAREHAGDIRLLVTDVVMPEMNGRELAEKLSLLRPGLKCLYMSGYTSNVIAHRGVLAEGVQFIQKPFSAQSLAAKVRETLDGRS